MEDNVPCSEPMMGAAGMGGLVTALMRRCRVCKATALPLSISGVYLAGERVILHECPNCHTVLKHGSLGLTTRPYHKNRPKYNGRLSKLLMAHARRETHIIEDPDYLNDD